jgi:hypothetical protein
MVRKGSPVRVRQRALRISRDLSLSVERFRARRGNMRGTSGRRLAY